jgi:hypothetical protein
MIPRHLAERVWRVRRNHTSIDAQVRDCADSPAVEVQLFYDGALIITRRWPTRTEALACAADQLQELQRAGWVTHW